MKKKVFSLILLLFVAICGGVFVACGVSGDNASISLVSGLDRLSSAETLSSISNELFLTETESGNLSLGMGYDGSVSSTNALTLVVGSETNASRQVTVDLSGFPDGTTATFSSDAKNISISEVSYSGSRATVTITATSSGTAEVYVQSGQFGKTTSFVVKAVEKLESFSVKTGATIYLERGKTLEINPESYLNFYPSAALKDVLFYDGDVLLTSGGKTVLSTEAGEGVTGVISESKEIVVRSTRLSGSASVQTISVVVVENLSSLSLNKMVYEKTGAGYQKTYQSLENGGILTVIRNVSNGDINYGVREVFVVVDCFEEKLSISASTNLEGANVLIVPTAIEQITQENYRDSQYSSLVDISREEFSTWVFKFEIKYEGYSSYQITFNFQAEGYQYSESLSVNAEFRSASNVVELIRAGSEEQEDVYTIYDSYVGQSGTRFVISTNQSDEFSRANLSLIFGSDSVSNFVLYDMVGNIKQNDNGEYSFSSGENFFVRAVTGSARTEPYVITARISYTFENVDFVVEREISLLSVNAPNDIMLSDGRDSLESYNFDLNTSGQIVSGINQTENYSQRNTLTLYVSGLVGAALIGDITDFAITNTSGILQATKEGNTIVLTALSTGSGEITVTIGNGVSKVFRFNIVSSVGEASAFIPSSDQNQNIIALLTNYENAGIVYDQYAIVKNSSSIPLILDYVGNIDSISVVSADGNTTYLNGLLTFVSTFDKQEISVSITFDYIGSNGEIEERTVLIQRILFTSIIEVEAFDLSTDKGSNTFNLYDYSTVGYYSSSLATAYVTLNILPSEIQLDILQNVQWETNIEGASVVREDDQIRIVSSAFEFTFYLSGANAGTGVFVCNVTDESLYDQNGNFVPGRIILSASYSRAGEGDDEAGVFFQTLQIGVRRARRVEVIDASQSSINLDPYTSSVKINVEAFPINATNLRLNYVFIPNSGTISADTVEITYSDNEATITLKKFDVAGNATLRIIAYDSYTTAGSFTTYLDIPINIANGSEQNPYVISTASDIHKMIDTNFAYYYKVVGTIDVSSIDWAYGQYVLTGAITSDNGATLSGFEIDSFTQEGNSYYSGIFKEISGMIENVSFETRINLDFTGSSQETDQSSGYIGALAAINKGTIKNCYVKIDGGEIKGKGSLYFYFGGLVGQNNGTIITEITSDSTFTNLVSYENKLTFDLDTNSTFSLYIGGAVGENTNRGSIERTIESGLVEFNNGFTTVDVNLEISITNSTNSTVAVGGIVGYNSGNVLNVSAIGTLSASTSNNVGGIVGNNSGTLSGGKTQVYVLGSENVGGAVGHNSGDISFVKVENIYLAEHEITLISGINNVGGIVGNMAGGSLTSSSFISYYTTSQSTGFDLVGTTNFGRIVGAYASGTIDFVVSIANIGATDSTFTSNNYAIYDRGEETGTVYVGGTEASLSPTELKETEGFEFIFLPTGEISIDLSDDEEDWKGIGGKLEGETEEGFYLYYYSSSDEEVMGIVGLNSVLLSRILTSVLGENYMVESLNTSILTIESGNLIVRGVGNAQIKITSPYVTGQELILYVKIVNYANNVQGYLDQSKNTEIGNNLTFDATDPTTLYFDFLDKFNIDGFATPYDVNLLFIAKHGGYTWLITTDGVIYSTGAEQAPFSIIKNSYNNYQLVPNGVEYQGLSVSIVPYFSYIVNGNTLYSFVSGKNVESYVNFSDYIGERLERNPLLSVNSQIQFNLELENQTKSINLSKNSIETEPYYVVDVDFVLNTTKTDEIITISVFDLNGDLVSNQVGLSTSATEVFNYSGRITIENVMSETIYFRMNDSARQFETTKQFRIELKSSNGRTAYLTLTYQPQEVLSVSTELFPLQSIEDEPYNFNGAFSYIPSGILIPGQNSLIEFKITPSFTYFETVEVLNVQTNQYNLVFDLYDRTTGAIVGGTTIDGGISILRDEIENGFFSLRTFADQRLEDNSYVGIILIFKDSNGNQIGQSYLKEFYVEHLPGVVLTVDGISSGNDENNPHKLAEGVSYELGVSVKGYSSGTFSGGNGLYTDGQIVFELSGNTSLISIVKNSDGTYVLQVNDNVLTDGASRTVAIKSYGINARGERSREVTLYLEIVKFVVKAPSDSGDIISGVVDDIYASATGNSYTLEISLNSDILIYNRNNPETRQAVLTFLASLSTGYVGESDGEPLKADVWSLKEIGQSSSWVYINESAQGFVGDTGNNIKYTTAQNVFEVYYNTKTHKVVIKFLRTETSAAPTLQIRFAAFFTYNNNGVPVLTTQSDTQNKFYLEQTISFDISERTELRNPFPIYTYEQLLDMREGNYYILMNDITLPEDFTPIQTQIGGLDGNNYRIYVNSISLMAQEDQTSLNFGLFASTSSDCLLKNIILYVNGNIEISTYNYSTVVYGLLVAENHGKITNCAVEGPNLAMINLNLFGPSSATVSNQVGGLVGSNYGDVSNSRIEVGISINSIQTTVTGYMAANLGGLVAINQGTGSISSSYVKARIENNSAGSSSAITGGFVAQNYMGGRIFACYIMGDSTDVFQTQTEIDSAINKVYSASGRAGGFVFYNNGTISNSFSNVPIVAVEGAAGFVYQNDTEGNISYCYSSSALENSARNGSFVGVVPGTSQEEGSILNSGTMEECYSWGEGNDNSDPEASNVGLGSNDGVSGLFLISSGKFQSSFEKYAFTNSADQTQAVWFWASANGDADFIKDGGLLRFPTEIPQLVSPNIIAAGHKTLLRTEYNEETEKTIYYYSDDPNYQEGSQYNPYIISTQEDIEFLVSSQSGFTNGNLITCAYSRLIGDINYESSTISSSLYQYSFVGNLEGNGYVIGNYVLDSSSQMTNAGFFATIGTASNNGGSVKNITFAPRYISLTNSNAVGAVAGAIYGGTLVNIIVDGQTYASEIDGVTILGKNAVGGVVGLAEGQFVIKNIEANISVNSTYRASLNNHNVMEYERAPLSQVSYAGLIAGVLNGYGTITYAEAYGDNVSVGENAALLFGYVGRNVVASNLTATGSLNQFIKADVYGGVIAARNLGTLSDIVVNGDTSASYTGFFAYDNFVPLAIGNIVGYMTNGTISNATVSTRLRAQSGVESLGGAVGLMSAGRLEDIVVVGDITGGYKIGGLVGQVRDATGNTIRIKNSFHGGMLTSNSSSDIVAVGKIIGFVSNYGETEGTTIAAGSNEDSLENPTIGIVFTSEFSAEYTNLIDSGVYDMSVRVTTYSSASRTEIWVGAIVVENAGTFAKKELNYDAIYSPSISVENIYAPLSGSYYLNGNIVQTN